MKNSFLQVLGYNDLFFKINPDFGFLHSQPFKSICGQKKALFIGIILLINNIFLYKNSLSIFLREISG